MRSDEPLRRRQNAGPLDGALGDGNSFYDDRGSAITSRGARYWSSGSIPLIGPELLGDIIAGSSDLSLVIDPEGKILSVLVNQNYRAFGRLDHWEGRNVRDVLTVESVPKLDQQIQAIQDGTERMRPAELNHMDSAQWEFPIQYSFHRIGQDDTLLMLGRDLRPVAEMQQQLVKAQMALERDYEAQRDFDTRYRVLMEATREAIVFVNVSNGRMTDVNNAAAVLLGCARNDLQGAAFAQEFEGRRRGEFLDNLSNVAVAEHGRPIELQTRRTKKQVCITPSVFRASGERLLLCRIEMAETGDAVADELTENLSGLYQDGPDAMVFTDANGIITAANESFLNLADVAHATTIKGKPLSTYMARGSVDTKVLLENAARAGKMRVYATKLEGEYGNQVSVEISATYLNDRAHPAYVFVIRDASRVEAVRKPGMPVSDDAVRSVMELVGSATLKDIVSETTDVVEKMCIETAVELTRNNRVAAAEMLGLSRQSLYVKLRKYDLLARDGEA